MTHFENAYCIQSRLARELVDQGRFGEAEVHLRRAFELMPDSFGRMESHCFGCEKAFTTGRGQQIAEQVFDRLLLKSPKKPQLYYLRGYLRFEQERYAEALPDFRRATELDPDYINAYRKIQEITEYAAIPAVDQNSVTLNLLRLDPAQTHTSDTVLPVSGVRQLYDLAARLQEANLIPDNTSRKLLPLRVSAATLPRWRQDNIYDMIQPEPVWESRTAPLTPRLAVLRQEVVASLITFVEALPSINP